MTVDEIVKLLLAVAFSVSLLGIAIQLMRVLGTFNDILQDVRHVAYKVSAFIEILHADYVGAKSQLKAFSAPFISLRKGVEVISAKLAKFKDWF